MTYSPDTLEAMARLGLPMDEMDLDPAPVKEHHEPASPSPPP